MRQIQSNRFDVFSGNDYYAYGGGEDYKASFDSIELGVEYVQNVLKPDMKWNWWHIWDSIEKKIVSSSGDES